MNRLTKATTAPAAKTSRIAAAAYVATAAIDTWFAGAEAPDAKRIRLITKSALMPLLALASRPAPAKLFAAQGFSWGGDVALLADGEAAFLGGAGSFGIAHGAYWSLWRERRDRSRSLWSRPSTKVLAAGVGAAAPVIAIASGRKDPVLGGAVAAYSVALTAVAAQALALSDEVDPQARRLIGAGALAFLASDTILGANMFVLPQRSAVAERAVMATYTIAQGLLAAGVRRL